jgi:hypothetical protein
MMEERDSVRSMAERIARQLSQGDATQPREQRRAGPSISDELAAVRAGLDELHKRLVRIESHVSHGAHQAAPTLHSPWAGGTYLTDHASEERFGVTEATVSELVDFFEGGKSCGLEPGKPCDHCAMCSSRGF